MVKGINRFLPEILQCNAIGQEMQLVTLKQKKVVSGATIT